ncbi:unnamed protein product [Absidia cylindrospora]
MSRSESDEKKKTEIFKHIVNNYTAFEQRWLIRIILKDLKMGMSENSIFDVYHPQARELYSVCSNLKRVCADLEDPSVKLGKAVISLFRPFKPQLGYKGQPKDMAHVKHNGVFYIEEKIDGERMQMHYEEASQKFKWFSRKATDYTELYGSSSMEEGKLSYEISGCLKKAKSLILDGEMVAYDPKLDVFLPFGTLKTSAKDESLDPDKAHPCLIIFDIVYYNGAHLVDYPLSDRLKLLEAVITEKRGYLNILKHKEKTQEQDIVDEVGIVVEQRQEGIMLKHPGSRYECGERSRTWIKIKPEYFDSLGENCDLIVVGGKYGTGRRGNQIAQFMCALRDDRRSTADEPFFVSFSMIGTGFSFDEIKEFGKFFKDTQRYDPKKLPPWLAHPEKSTDIPDVLVKDFHNAVVIEVKASEVVFSQMWSAGCTLRFPRFIRFRHDKSWKETMTYSEIMRVRRSAGQKQKTFSQQDFTIDPNKKQKKSTSQRSLKSSLGLVLSQQGVGTENINQVSNLFGGLNFYVIIGMNNTVTKAKLEYMIKENGGEFVQSDDKANYVIAGKHNIRVDSIIHKKTCNIIMPQWIFDCVAANQILPLSPKYMLYATDQTKKEFSIKMDKYGDSYMEYATDESLKEIWDDIPSNIRKIDVDDIRQKYFSNDGFPGMFFYGVHAYFYNKDQQQHQQVGSERSGNSLKTMTMEWVHQQHQLDNFKIMAILIRFYGGSVTQDKHDSTITHVIMQEDQNESDIAIMTRQFGSLSDRLPYFVTPMWIQKCVENETLLDETRYDVKIPSLYQ